MKYKRVSNSVCFLFTAAVCVITLLVSCNTNEPNNNGLKDTIDQKVLSDQGIIQDSMDVSQAFEKEMGRQIELNLQLITDYKNKIAKGKKEGRSNEYETLELLEVNIFAMRYELENTKADTTIQREIYKSDFTRRIVQLNLKVRKAIGL